MRPIFRLSIKVEDSKFLSLLIFLSFSSNNCYFKGDRSCNVFPRSYNCGCPEIKRVFDQQLVIVKFQKNIVHYRNLQLYLSLGMRLKKIHHILAFDQAPWLKSYIDFNTCQRAAASNDFEKDFFKLMNNSMFGKTMESLRNRRKVDLVVEEKKV